MYKIIVTNLKGELKNRAEFKTIDECKEWYRGYIYGLNPNNNESENYPYQIRYYSRHDAIIDSIIKLERTYQENRKNLKAYKLKEIIVNTIADSIDEFEQSYGTLKIELYTENQNLIKQVNQRRLQNALSKMQNKIEHVIRK